MQFSCPLDDTNIRDTLFLQGFHIQSIYRKLTMELLDFARGPGLQLAVTIFVVGLIWRLFHLYLTTKKSDISEARQGGEIGILRERERRGSTGERGDLGRSEHFAKDREIIEDALQAVVSKFAAEIEFRDVVGQRRGAVVIQDERPVDPDLLRTAVLHNGVVVPDVPVVGCGGLGGRSGSTAAGHTGA